MAERYDALAQICISFPQIFDSEAKFYAGISEHVHTQYPKIARYKKVKLVNKKAETEEKVEKIVKADVNKKDVKLDGDFEAWGHEEEDVHKIGEEESKID